QEDASAACDLGGLRADVLRRDVVGAVNRVAERSDLVAELLRRNRGPLLDDLVAFLRVADLLHPGYHRRIDAAEAASVGVLERGPPRAEASHRAADAHDAAEV